MRVKDNKKQDRKQVATKKTRGTSKSFDIKDNKEDYKKAYDILMDYFDYIPEEDKEEVDRRLKECNL